MKLHTLLAATDFSAPSRHAAKRAAMLAKQTGSQFELMHVIEKNALAELQQIFGGNDKSLQDSVRDQAREAMSQLATDTGEPLGVTAGIHIIEGAVLESCISQADVLDASLIIVGARGVGFRHNWLLGTTAERLLSKTLRPVLVVKATPHDNYSRVLIPVDFSPWSESAIRLALKVAPNAEFILMHAFEVPFESKLRFAGVDDEIIQRYLLATREEAHTRLQKIARTCGLAAKDWSPVIIHGDASSRVLEQEEELGADLIVLGKHGNGLTEELLLGSVTMHVLSQARNDVLVAYR